MPAILIGTSRPLTNDERCMSLVENDAITPTGKDWRRLQTIRVVRDGELVEFVRDMGSSASFSSGPFCIMSLEADSVGEVLDQAHELRLDQGLKRAMDDHRAEVNVISDLITLREQMSVMLRRNSRTIRGGKK